MVFMSRLRFLLPLALLVGALSACNTTCESLCEEEGAFFDECLPEQGLSWEDMNYPDGVEEYIGDCSRRWAFSLQNVQSQNGASRQDVLSVCQSRLSEIRSSTCSDLPDML